MDLSVEALRSIPSLTGKAPELDTARVPAEPNRLFAEWLQLATECGVPEPLSATLSTVDSEGIPDARVLRLKTVDERGWAFASTASSRKGHQLAAHAAASLSLWWQPQMRAVRLRGRVAEASDDESLADLAARSEAARAEVDPEDWRLWRLQPVRIEFWQGSPDRRHTRIVYTRSDDWDVQILSE